MMWIKDKSLYLKRGKMILRIWLRKRKIPAFPPFIGIKKVDWDCRV